MSNMDDIQNQTTPAADPSPDNSAPGNPTDTANTEVGTQGADNLNEQDGTKANSILGNKDKENPTQANNEGNPEEVQFDFSELGRETGADMNDPSVDEFKNVLHAVGIKDNEVANKIAKFGIQYAVGQLEMYRDRIAEQKFEEAHKEFGSTPDRPSESFEKAVGMAGKALSALEGKVPGLADAILESGMDNDVRVLKAFALIGEMVGEDGNVMSGGSRAHSDDLTAKSFFNNTK